MVDKFNVENKRAKLLFGLGLGGVLRVVVMSFVNYYVILYIAPFYLDFITGLLGATGLPNSTTFEVMTWTLIITGIYNLAHSLFSIVPAYYITGLIRKRLS